MVTGNDESSSPLNVSTLNRALTLAGMFSVTSPECEWNSYCPPDSIVPRYSTSPLTVDAPVSLERTFSSVTSPLVDSACNDRASTSCKLIDPLTEPTWTSPDRPDAVTSPETLWSSTRSLASLTSTSPLVVFASTGPRVPLDDRSPEVLRRMTREPSGTESSYLVSPMRPR